MSQKYERRRNARLWNLEGRDRKEFLQRRVVLSRRVTIEIRSMQAMRCRPGGIPRGWVEFNPSEFCWIPWVCLINSECRLIQRGSRFDRLGIANNYGYQKFRIVQNRVIHDFAYCAPTLNNTMTSSQKVLCETTKIIIYICASTQSRKPRPNIIINYTISMSARYH